MTKQIVAPPSETRSARVGLLVFSSWLWHLTRWDGLFLCTYLVAHHGGNTLAVQFVGVAMFCPMMLGSLLAKRLRHGLSPRRAVIGCQLTLIPLATLFAVLIGTGSVLAWTVYPLELAFGIGMMINMTAQRELLIRSAGEGRGSHALSMEIAGQSSASMLGPLIGGVSIELIGLGGAFGVLVGILVTSVSVLSVVSRGPLPVPSVVASGLAGRREPPARSLSANVRHLLSYRQLAYIMGVTVFANLCCFSFMPLIPVIAKRLHADAAMAGVIGSISGGVQLVVCFALVLWPVRRLSTIFASSVTLSMVALGLLAYAPTVAIAILVLAVLGLGQGLFSNVQSLLTVKSVPEEDRAGALGLLTTTIGGAMPAGMVMLGVTSTVFGDQPGMLVSPLIGLVALAVVLRLTVLSPATRSETARVAAEQRGMLEEAAQVVG